ncbi:hypothetical protein D3C72_1508540 [compost metagenome]
MEEGRAKEEQQPESPGEAQRQNQLHPCLPRRVEIVVEVGDPAAARDCRNDQMVGDEEGGGAEGDHREAQIGRPEVVAGLLRRIVPAQQGQNRSGDHAPERQRPDRQPPDSGQQHDGRKGAGQNQCREQRRVGRGPDQGVVRRHAAIQTIEQQTLHQTDAYADSGQPPRAAQRGAAGLVVERVGHGVAPSASPAGWTGMRAMGSHHPSPLAEDALPQPRSSRRRPGSRL